MHMKKLGFWGFVGRWEGFCFSVVDIFCGLGEYFVYNCMVVFCGVNGIYLFVFGTIKRTFKPSIFLDIFLCLSMVCRGSGSGSGSGGLLADALNLKELRYFKYIHTPLKIGGILKLLFDFRF